MNDNVIKFLAEMLHAWGNAPGEEDGTHEFYFGHRALRNLEGPQVHEYHTVFSLFGTVKRISGNWVPSRNNYSTTFVVEWHTTLSLTNADIDFLNRMSKKYNNNADLGTYDYMFQATASYKLVL